MIKPKNDIDNEAFKGCDSNLKSELVDIVNQYDEMFQEPKGLSPKRGIQHEIQLQQDCPLPNIGMYRIFLFLALWFTYCLGVKEGWNMAHVCGLSRIKQNYSKELLPTVSNRLFTGSSKRCKVFY